MSRMRRFTEYIGGGSKFNRLNCKRGRAEEGFKCGRVKGYLLTYISPHRSPRFHIRLGATVTLLDRSKGVAPGCLPGSDDKHLSDSPVALDPDQ